MGPESGTLEYAVERKILETPLLEVSYYADVVGRVPVDHRSGTAGLESFDIGNGDLPPEWGVDVVVRGGFLRYGPWADRQRYVVSCGSETGVLIVEGLVGPSCSGRSSRMRTMMLSRRRISNRGIRGYGRR